MKRNSTAILVNQSVGYLTIDVCNAFANYYQNVILLAGSVSEISRSLSSNVEVIEICRYDKSSIFKRIYSWIKGGKEIKNFLNRFKNDADVLYFTNPPISYMWADKMSFPFGIVEYDIYPDALKNIKCPQQIIKWWAKRNKEIFSKARGIITLGEGMKDKLTQYVASDKILVVPNWGADEKPEVVEDDQNPFVKTHNLNDKFVVMYSGNIGYTHNVEIIIEVANRLKDYENVRFLIIGEGGKKNDLIKLVKERQLRNVIFSDYLPADQLKYSMSCANLGVVTLTKETAKVSVPSKTYNLLSYGIPLLGISPAESELGIIIGNNECGGYFESNDVSKVVEFIKKCLSNKHYYNQIRLNAQQASRLFSMENAKEYVKIFKTDKGESL